MGYMENGGVLKYRKGGKVKKKKKEEEGGGMAGLSWHRKKCTVEAWLHICLLATDQRCLNMPGLWLE